MVNCAMVSLPVLIMLRDLGRRERGMNIKRLVAGNTTYGEGVHQDISAPYNFPNDQMNSLRWREKKAANFERFL